MTCHCCGTTGGHLHITHRDHPIHARCWLTHHHAGDTHTCEGTP